jgi:hypothetical protein
MNPTVAAAIAAAREAAARQRMRYVGGQHLLLGALAQRTDPSVALLAEHDLSYEATARTYERVFRGVYGDALEKAGEKGVQFVLDAAESLAALQQRIDDPNALGYLLLLLLERRDIAYEVVRERLHEAGHPNYNAAVEALANVLRASLPST